jgi:myosin heavy subunit
MSAVTYELGSWVWIADEEQCYLPAKVSKSSFKAGLPGTVKTEDGESVGLTAKQTGSLVVCNEEVLDPKLDNLIQLNDLNEQAILHNLRIRWLQDNIYTSISSILISVNPFKLLPLYTPEILDQYKDSRGRGLAPHVFAVADNAYRSMLADHSDQSLVISGESGAGKTEATKLILQYLAEVSGQVEEAEEGNVRSEPQGDSDSFEGLEQQILQANPVMESFGNATTVRNDNSSRFGKLISLQFNNGGSIVGGYITQYLLEKSRVVRTEEGERNYHIFYQLLKGLDAEPALQEQLMLLKAEDYHYCNQSSLISVEGMPDDKGYDVALNAMEVLQIKTDEQLVVLHTIAALLHWGNIEFSVAAKATQEDESRIVDLKALEKGCQLLQIDKAKLQKSLLCRSIGVGSLEGGEDIRVSYNVAQAADARDAMAKAVYDAVFKWLISRINQTLEYKDSDESGKKKKTKKHQLTALHALDIFGFESIQTNSFEQLCINYCNEKLQFHFNEHIFKLEQAEYEKEGVHVPATAFIDNSECLKLLEEPRAGIFGMIDEELNIPKGSDAGFLSKVFREHGSHPNLKAPNHKDSDAKICFCVSHFAGVVKYTSTHFLEKNKDSLHADIATALNTTTHSAFTKELLSSVQTLGGAGAGAGGRGGGAGGGRRQSVKRRASTLLAFTLGFQFKQQLTLLMQTLYATSPHFVRCMKPNGNKSGDEFDGNLMIAQLRYAGLLEVCRIRQIGYPVRKEFAAFIERYRCIAESDKGTQSTSRKAVLKLTAAEATAGAEVPVLLKALTEMGVLHEGQFAKGDSKVRLTIESVDAL